MSTASVSRGRVPAVRSQPNVRPSVTFVRGVMLALLASTAGLHASGTDAGGSAEAPRSPRRPVYGRDGTWEGARKVVVPFPPDASLISVETPDADGFTTVTGAAGAVVANALVSVACLDTAMVLVVQADAQGAFTAKIFAPGGTHLQIKHNYPFMTLEAVWDLVGRSVKGENLLKWLTGTAGTIVAVPLNHAPVEGRQPFQVTSSLSVEAGEAYWTFSGELGPLRQAGQDLELPISGTLRVVSSALSPGMDTSTISAAGRLDLVRIFDENGRQVPISRKLVSDFMTPTGFPVARGASGWSPSFVQVTPSSWTQVADDTLEATVDTTLTFPASTAPGLYRTAARFSFGSSIPLAESNPTMNYFPSRPSPNSAGALLPAVQVGQPAQPRLTAALLTDTYDEATRGVLSQEDAGKVGLIPLTSLQNEDVIVPLTDPRSGRPAVYRLEPFLPLAAWTDRGLPNPPAVYFAFPSGSLQVTVAKPDGTVDTIGPAPLTGTIDASPSFPDATLQGNLDGGDLHDVLQLSTGNGAFLYEFTQYGEHAIHLTGTVDDVWGNTYILDSTFDIHVARRLKVYAGMLPTTPFEVGDGFAPSLQVRPAVPADVEVRFRLLVNSDPTQAYERVVSGRANRFGYFHPGAELEPITIPGPGEYRVDVFASYLAGNGTLWEGAQSWGGVVERPGTPLVAHGRRGLDSDPSDVPPVLWFVHDQLGFQGVAHTNYPYHSGDVFWGLETTADTTPGAEAIFPVITVQDTGGTVYDLMEDRWEAGAHPTLFPWETLADRIAAGEAPLFSSTSTGVDPSWSPKDVDVIGYAYRTSERPGVRVHESVAEDSSLGIGYWRYNAPFGDQAGIEGDLPHDLKWEFGGAVFRYPAQGINEYAIYGSLWVLIPKDDALGPRVMPPFQGAAGGPDGGPIMELKDEEIDLFFYPRNAGAGAILAVGDTFSLAGHVGPPFPSLVNATITPPTGPPRTVSGRANKVGFFYQRGSEFVVDQPGEWTVDLEVTHDGMTSAGPVQEPYPTGGVLGASGGRYSFYVVPPDAPDLELLEPRPGFLTFRGGKLVPIDFVLQVPEEVSSGIMFCTISMPGVILDQGSFTTSGRTLKVTYDPETLSQDYPNLDLRAHDERRDGLADQVWISVLFTDGTNVHARAITLHGEEVLVP